MSILVLNTGSSSLKFSLFDDQVLETSITGQVDWHDGQSSTLTVKPTGQAERTSECQVGDPGAAATLVIATVNDPGIAAIGHRVVHGGTKFHQSIRIDQAVEAEIKHLTDLAPLHNPPALLAIDAAIKSLPGVPQVAVFDTSFFAHLPRSAAIYPVPQTWTKDYGIRKFGFHGISHSYCSTRAAEILGRDIKTLKIVVCHLGNGASAAAINGGIGVDTTMGFTPLTGLMMGTRSGEVDPGVLLYLMKEKGLTADQVDNALNHESGLIGVSGVSNDYRKVEQAATKGDDNAKLALEIYAARVRSSIGALAATLGGLDALVFAAGVGENSAMLRAAACNGLEFLGVRLDHAKNEASPRDSDIARAESTARVLVIHTREDLVIARETRRIGLYG